MALQKFIDLPTGVTGTYLRIVGFRWDRDAREASATFALFKDAATAAMPNGRPLVPVAAKLRLYGDAFDTYLGPAMLAASKKDAVGLLYAAAKAVSADFAKNGEKNTRAHVVSDYGKALFAGASDV